MLHTYRFMMTSPESVHTSGPMNNLSIKYKNRRKKNLNMSDRDLMNYYIETAENYEFGDNNPLADAYNKWRKSPPGSSEQASHYKTLKNLGDQRAIGRSYIQKAGQVVKKVATRLDEQILNHLIAMAESCR